MKSILILFAILAASVTVAAIAAMEHEKDDDINEEDATIPGDYLGV